MAGSYATPALNTGAAVGPVVAAATLGTEAGARGPLRASGLLVAVALLIAFPLLTAITVGRNTEVLQ
jgi:DHA1 family chloramphenicol resistance protein-like MFS transporter